MLNKIVAEMDRIAARLVAIRLVEVSLHAEKKRLTKQHAELAARLTLLIDEQQQEDKGSPSVRRHRTRRTI